MISLDFLLLGYVVYEIREEDILTVSNLFVKNGISIEFKGNKFSSGLFKAKQIDRLLAPRVKFSKSQPMGLFGFLYRSRRHIGAAAAIFLISLLVFLSNDLVWDVRVEGCEGELSEKIEAELRDCGFFVGASWSENPTGKVEAKLLSISECVSWVNINRRGNVAYIKVIEKQTHTDPKEKEGYANIVAKCDAVIEEITVIHGVAAVKAGDIVKKGDLLISGVITTESSVGYCYAEGIVRGRVSDSVSVSVEREKQVESESVHKLSRTDVKIFDFCANIFNSYRKTEDKCDIIEKKSCLTLFGVRLPISLERQYKVYRERETVILSHDEMVSEASALTEQLLAELLKNSTLIRIKTSGSFTDGKYTMVTDMVYTEEIGCDLPFEIIQR